MTKIIINQIEALQRIKNGESLANFEVVFDEQTIEAMDAFRLGKNGIIIPEHLVYYDDSTIDYSDIADDENPEYYQMFEVLVMAKVELAQWLKAKNINLSDLLRKLLQEYYEKENIKI